MSDPFDEDPPSTSEVSHSRLKRIKKRPRDQNKTEHSAKKITGDYQPPRKKTKNISWRDRPRITEQITSEYPVNLSEDSTENTLRIDVSDDEYYFFVEAIEPIYPAEDSEETEPNYFWIEFSGIKTETVKQAIQDIGYDKINPNELADNEESKAMIERRKRLWGAMLDNPKDRCTLYMSILDIENVPLGDWVHLAAAPISTDEIDFSIETWSPADQDGFNPILAADPYIGTGFAARFMDMEITAQVREMLREIFSLNHISDIEPPEDSGPGRPGPLPVPSSPPPILQFTANETALEGWTFQPFGQGGFQSGFEALKDAASWWAIHGDNQAQIRWDPNNACWLLFMLFKTDDDAPVARTIETEAGLTWVLLGSQAEKCWLFISNDPPAFALVQQARCDTAKDLSPEHEFTSRPWPPSYAKTTLVET